MFFFVFVLGGPEGRACFAYLQIFKSETSSEESDFFKKPCETSEEATGVLIWQSSAEAHDSKGS